MGFALVAEQLELVVFVLYTPLLLSAVGGRLDLVDAHQPVDRGVGFLEILELNVLVADLGAAHAIEARRTS